VELLSLRGSSVAHCPLSNGYFAGAALPVKALMIKGVKVGEKGREISRMNEEGEIERGR
jgi:hypothetical protein